jgi:hypothetical protein
MLQGLMNLPLTGIDQVIEDVLDEYPAHPYQSAFSMPELRQKLIAHILSQLPHCPEVESINRSSNPDRITYHSRLQARLRLEMLVRGSILHILRKNATWLSHHLY